jgi:hypothetical protein
MAALTKEAGIVFPSTVGADLLLASTALGQSIASSGEKFYTTAK